MKYTTTEYTGNGTFLTVIADVLSKYPFISWASGVAAAPVSACHGSVLVHETFIAVDNPVASCRLFAEPPAPVRLFQLAGANPGAPAVPVTGPDGTVKNGWPPTK